MGCVPTVNVALTRRVLQVLFGAGPYEDTTIAGATRIKVGNESSMPQPGLLTYRNSALVAQSQALPCQCAV